jgi:hypothetical protein
VKANDRLFPGVRLNRKNVKAAAGGIDAARAKELARHAGEVAALVGVDGVFGSGLRLCCRRTSFHFDEGEGAAVVADQIDFTFNAWNGVVARYQRVAVAAEVPVSEGFAADACLAGFGFCGWAFAGLFD